MSNSKNPRDFLRLYCSWGENPEPRLWSKRKLAWATLLTHLSLRFQIMSTCHPDLPCCSPHQGCSLPPVLCWLLPVSVPSLICSIDHFQLLPSTFSIQHWWLPHFLAPDCLNAEKFSSGDAALSASFKASDSKGFVPSKCNSLLWTLHLFLEGQFSGPIEPKSGKFPMTFSSWLLLRTLANLPNKKIYPFTHLAGNLTQPFHKYPS